MKYVIGSIVLILAISALASRECYAEDVATSDPIGSNGVRFVLSDQPCPFGGYMWWHADDASGKTLMTGCWTSGKGVVWITDGKGNAWKVPASKFH